MRPKTNQTVQTPLGVGVAQSATIHVAGVVKHLIRLLINEQTKPHLKDSNCITPRAEHSGLWVFTEDELSDVGKPKKEDHDVATN